MINNYVYGNIEPPPNILTHVYFFELPYSLKILRTLRLFLHL